MKIIKTILLILSLMNIVIVAENLNSTSFQKLSLTAKLGYGFPSGGILLREDPQHIASVTIDPKGIATSRNDKYLNYGNGIKIDMGANIGLMENLLAEATLSITAGIPYLTIKRDNTAFNGTEFKDTYKKSNVALKAILKPTFTILDLLDMYVGVGCGIYFSNLTYTTTDPVSTHEGYIKTKPALGLIGQLGAIFPLNDLTSLIFEVSFDKVSFTTKERMELTDPNKIVSKRNDSSTEISDYVEQPIKIPGSNTAIKAGIQFSIL